MELDMGQRLGVLLMNNRFLTGIRAMIKHPQKPEHTCTEISSELKEFCQAEQLREPLELINIHEKMELNKTMSIKRIL
ncbi:MAG: hypothetical protein GX144_05805 [Clostridiaceae bacterium]|jgi:hypothetical protein|nr:hypothetical protein [Clostridiaceae bacterium]